MPIAINGVTLPAPQDYARSPVIKHVDYVSLNETVLRDRAAGPAEWSYVLTFEALTGDEFKTVYTAWTTIIAGEGVGVVYFTDLDGVSYYAVPDGEAGNSFTHTVYRGCVSTNPTYTTLYDCTLTFKAGELA